MPKTKFDPSNVKQSGNKFPPVKLGADEIWRVVIVEDPTYEWAHRLERPKLSAVTGKLQMKTIKFNNGDEKVVPDTVFVGAPRCRGNIDTLEDKGIDKVNCPICAAALQFPDYFAPPERKYAVHVLKYGTKAGSSQPVSPLNLETKVWRLTEKRFAKIVDVIQEFGGDFTSVDLILGPCNNATFQNYEIQGSSKCVIATSEETRKRALETFQGNNAGDLADYCAPPKSEDLMRSDVNSIAADWKKAYSGDSEPEEIDFSETLSDSGAALLGGSEVAAKEQVPEVSLDDTISAPPKAASASTVPAPATVKQGESVDFGSLIDSLSNG